MIGFPRLATRFEFQSSVVFEDEIDIHLWVRRRGTKTLTYQFSVTKDGRAVAKGEFTVESAMGKGTTIRVQIPFKLS